MVENEVIIYVAGNPDAYPLEYYDNKTESYQGVIPKLLHDFSASSKYEITYYQPGTKDNRAHLAKNKQVDMLTGYTQGEALPKDVQTITLFHTKQNHQEENYYLCFTDAAPVDLKKDFESYIQDISQEQISGLILEHAAAGKPQEQNGPMLAIYGLALTVILLCASIGILLQKYRKKLKKAREKMERDALTGLGNMDHLLRYYPQFVNPQNRILYSLIYFHVDTERLQRLGNRMEAEEFLKYCAIILQEYTGNNDILCKISDEGFIMIKMETEEERLQAWLRPIFYRINEYSVKNEKPFTMTMSAGIYTLKSVDNELNEMIFDASQAAYAAESQGVPYLICSDKMLQKFAEEKRMQADIEKAFVREEFKIYIQFYIDAYSHGIIGGEVLSRWQHPENGLLGPDAFVPLMEEENLIDQLDYYNLKKSCDFLQSLEELGIEHFTLSCNFSRETFGALNFVKKCKEIIEPYTFPRKMLIFELTESVSEKSFSQIAQNIQEVKDYGISIALDDFGAGFTSFFDLQKYTIDRIKLDKSLIDTMMTKNGEAIINAMIQVGHDCGMEVIAEGVESDEEVQMLQKLQCDAIQGYRFYHPMPDWAARETLVKRCM